MPVLRGVAQDGGEIRAVDFGIQAARRAGFAPHGGWKGQRAPWCFDLQRKLVNMQWERRQDRRAALSGAARCAGNREAALVDIDGANPERPRIESNRGATCLEVELRAARPDGGNLQPRQSHRLDIQLADIDDTLETAHGDGRHKPRCGRVAGRGDTGDDGERDQDAFGSYTHAPCAS